MTFRENTSAHRGANREREYCSLEKRRAFPEKASPITYLDQLRAPLLAIRGAIDRRVPCPRPSRSSRPWPAGVRSELTVHADEDHGLRQAGQPQGCLSRSHRVSPTETGSVIMTDSGSAQGRDAGAAGSRGHPARGPDDPGGGRRCGRQRQVDVCGCLAESLEGLGRPVILIRADSFLNLSQVVTGWAAGRQSASGWRATTIRR